MTNKEMELLHIIRESENPTDALVTAIETIADFLKNNNL